MDEDQVSEAIRNDREEILSLEKKIKQAIDKNKGKIKAYVDQYNKGIGTQYKRNQYHKSFNEKQKQSKKRGKRQNNSFDGSSIDIMKSNSLVVEDEFDEDEKEGIIQKMKDRLIRPKFNPSFVTNFGTEKDPNTCENHDIGSVRMSHNRGSFF